MKILLRKLLVTSICVFEIFSVRAQWIHTNGPYGGFSGQLIEVDNVLFSDSGSGGIFRSDDLAETWYKVDNGLPVDEYITAFAESNGILYCAGFSKGIYKSTDLGENWTMISELISSVLFYNLFVDGNDIYAGPESGGLYVSTDGGESWTQTVVPGDLRFSEFIIYDNLIYSAAYSYTYGNQFLKSSDKGVTWDEVVFPDLPLYAVRAMAIKGNRFFAGNQNYIYYSDDAVNWTKSSMYINQVRSVTVSGDSVVLTAFNQMGNSGSLFYSKDDGVSWSEINTGLAYEIPFNIIIHPESMILSASGLGIYKSYDNAITWVERNEGYAAMQISILETDGNAIFASGGSRGLFKTETNGAAWQHFDQGLDWSVSDIQIVGEEIFATINEGLFSSSAGVDSWSNIHTPMDLNQRQYKLDFDNGVFVSAANTLGVQVSLDTGKTWNVTPADPMSLSTPNDILIVGDTIWLSNGAQKMFLTENLGNSWEDISSNIIPRKFRYSDGVLFATSYYGLQISNDLGRSWDLKEHGNIGSVADFLIENGKFYVATDEGIYISSISRQEWISVSGNIDQMAISSLLIKDDTLFAGGYASSVWKRALSEMNLMPIILGTQDALSTPEETILGINVTDLIIDDPDNPLDDFTLTVLSGTSYSVSNNNQVTPADNFNGTLNVAVIVSDGIDESPEFIVNVQVTPINDVPIIGGALTTFTTPMNEGKEIFISNFNIIDPDNAPADFTLKIQAGDNYTVDGNFVVPDLDFIGTLTVPIIVNDGMDDSEPFNITIDVTEVTALDDPNVFLKVFPNPAQDILVFQIGNNLFGKINYEIVNSLGRKLISKQIMKRRDLHVEEIEISSLAPGLYFLKLTGNIQTPVVHRFLVY